MPSPVQRAKLALFLGVSLPLQLLWHLPRGDAGDVWLKMRGVRDALADRRPPFRELGLASASPQQPRSGSSRRSSPST